jgi:hypothetical protein
MTPEEKIREAILKRRRLSFTYDGGTRMVDPYILGDDAEGRLLLSAVQVSGGSSAGFRTFSVDAIAAVAVTGQKFFGNHPDYNPRDRLFARVLCQIQPGK